MLRLPLVPNQPQPRQAGAHVVRDEVRWCGRIHHPLGALTAACASMSAPEWDDVPAVGFLYAVALHGGAALKVGGTRQCPFCRAGALKGTLLGFAYSSDWRENERLMLAALGRPSEGLETFCHGISRYLWLVDNGFIHPVEELAKLNPLPRLVR